MVGSTSVVSQALTSRYSIASYTFWLALFVGFLPALQRRLRSVPWAMPGYIAAVALVALALGYGASPSGADLRSLTVGRKATVVGYRAGVEDDTESIRDVQFVWTPVTNALRWLERERLGPFVPGGIVDGMRVTGPVNETGRRCLGELDPVEAVRGGNRLGGWIASPTGEASSPNLVVLDADGRRAGLGLVGFHRAEVERDDIPDASWTGFLAYVRDEPTGPLRDRHARSRQQNRPLSADPGDRLRLAAASAAFRCEAGAAGDTTSLAHQILDVRFHAGGSLPAHASLLRARVTKG